MSARGNRCSYISMHNSPKYSFLSPLTLKPSLFLLCASSLFRYQSIFNSSITIHCTSFPHVFEVLLRFCCYLCNFFDLQMFDFSLFVNKFIFICFRSKEGQFFLSQFCHVKSVQFVSPGWKMILVLVSILVHKCIKLSKYPTWMGWMLLVVLIED